MIWSYSNVSTYKDCPYKWYLKYVACHSKTVRELFFANYGKLMHELLSRYYAKEMTADKALQEYIIRFKDQVLRGYPPNFKVFENYFMSGIQYLQTLIPICKENILFIEKKLEFNVGDYKVVGIIDLCIEKGSGLWLIDHKSKSLRPRSHNVRKRKTDVELDEYLKQLYLYSKAISDLTGKMPTNLCFNCFRTNEFINEEFRETAYKNTLEWFQSTVEEIQRTTEYKPKIDAFKCEYICEMQDFCEYFQLFRR